MAIEVTTDPASPSVGDGVTITVVGAVAPRARVEVSLSGKVHETSPEFEQGSNPEGLNSAGYLLTITAATGGTYKLTVHGNQTGAIAFGANAAAIKAAIDAVLVSGESCTVTGTGPFTITFGGTDPVAATVDGTSLTGTGHAITLTATTVGGTQTDSTSGPFEFGPLFLPVDGTYSIDVVAAETTDDVDEGDSLLAAPVSLVVTA